MSAADDIKRLADEYAQLYDNHYMLGDEETARVAERRRQVYVVADALQSERDELLEALQDALEFIEDHVDVSDGPYGEPKPNRAMQLAEPIRALVARATGEPK